MKILLGSGCSWTDMRLVPKNTSWVHQLADDLEMLPLNVGQSGSGNLAIYNNVIDRIAKHEDNIGAVVVGWSASDRVDIETGLMQDKIDYGEHGKRDSIWPRGYLKYLGWRLKETEPPHAFSIGQVEFYKIMEQAYKEVSFEDMINIIVNRSLRYSYQLEIICKAKNIPLVQFQGIDHLFHDEDCSLWGKKTKDNIQTILKNIVDKSIFKAKYLGGSSLWSWDKHLKKLEGSAKDNPMYRIGYNQPSNFWVGYTGRLDFDWHPNELGHTVIKDLIKKELNS